MKSMQNILVGCLFAFISSPTLSTCSPTPLFNSSEDVGIAIAPRAEPIQWCYMPDGQSIPLGVGVKACQDNTKSGHSMCCKANEKCTRYGYCLATNIEENKWQAERLRGGCTDPTWKAPECLQVCLTKNDLIHVPGTAPEWQEPLLVCRDGLMCCGATGNDETDNCCRQHAGFDVELDKKGYPQLKKYADLELSGNLPPTSETTASTVPKPTSTSSNTEQPQETKDQGESNGLSKGTIALIVVVSSLSLCLSGCVAWLLNRRWKSYRERRQHEKEYAIFARGPELDGNCISEMGSSESTLGSRACTVVIAELPGSEVRSGEEHEMWTPGADTIMSRFGSGGDSSSRGSERSGSTSGESGREGAVSSNSGRSRDEIVSEEVNTVSRDFAAEMDAKFDNSPSSPTDQDARHGNAR